MPKDNALPGKPAKSDPVEPRQIAANPRGSLPARVASAGSGVGQEWVAKVEIYTRRFCADSMRTKGIFDRKHVQYNEYLIDNDIVNNSAMSQRTDGLKATPQVFIDGNHIGGLPQVMELERVGELDFLLGLGAS